MLHFHFISKSIAFILLFDYSFCLASQILKSHSSPFNQVYLISFPFSIVILLIPPRHYTFTVVIIKTFYKKQIASLIAIKWKKQIFISMNHKTSILFNSQMLLESNLLSVIKQKKGNDKILTTQNFCLI